MYKKKKKHCTYRVVYHYHGATGFFRGMEVRGRLQRPPVVTTFTTIVIYRYIAPLVLSRGRRRCH